MTTADLADPHQRPPVGSSLPMTPPGPRTAPGRRLIELWEEHRHAPYPPGFRGVNIAGVELVLVDADVAGVVIRELAGGLDADDIAILWACVAGLDKVVPLIEDEYCAAYFARLRTLARHTAARHVPSAS
ncbi:hypothetical protein [Streptomyces sp. NPDC020917]|uniref:hypothetical protein n=1 Tax=Streptomyces sp. NPDC020917 TaxID=3365102 RepID=UPI0037A54CB3